MRIQTPPWLVARAAHRGGLFPLRRLTTIRDGRSWRRDMFAGPTTTERIRSADGALSFPASTPPSVGSGLVVSRSGGFAMPPRSGAAAAAGSW
jgi:hypothetical protein